MKTLRLFAVALTITSITTTSVKARVSSLTPASPTLNSLPQTVQEVLSRGLSLEGVTHTEGESFNVFLGDSKKGESPIYFIRLPPTQRFYSKLSPYKNKIGKTVPMNFTLNGRPHKVYHYNLPYRKKLAEYRRRLQKPFHPFNHRSSGQTYRSFITKLELTVPKPPTALALPVFIPAFTGSEPKVTAPEPNDGSQPQFLESKPAVVNFKTMSSKGTASTSEERNAPTGRQSLAEVHVLSGENVNDKMGENVRKYSKDGVKNNKISSPKKMFSPESTFVELDFPKEENRLLGEKKISTHHENENIDLNVFSEKSQEKSQETFFDNTEKSSVKIASQGEDIFSESDKKLEDEDVLAGKMFMKAIKSRAQKISWAN